MNRLRQWVKGLLRNRMIRFEKHKPEPTMHETFAKHLPSYMDPPAPTMAERAEKAIQSRRPHDV